ncbi:MULTISPECIES: tetratricopeptide repeat protein [unclassified Campylobacter]|uniref:tetratricopeptide repeat protein n=1 Tax=unclassified Campylobacter TaxID=2593542 RepID=UPI0022E9FBFE|nr:MULTISPECIES: hypothetical protein [unclassified Campylobacter]MDA3054235.1 hypothetical protein [Campylobacter sp. VBCF_07 NA4]MDA3060926.1 hypothetical protein [Campylobacter sp. VBCF_02 NA5]MDA3070439.1 hypothetical protein [Campylobacter sp. VBCF_08 NA3]WBR53748.1 hypothetical protein PF027_05295 [Campylobacter sp. VBCF_01 NA2]
MKNFAKFLFVCGFAFGFANANDAECLGGDAKECFASAKAYEQSGDNAKAQEFYQKACELNYAVGCNKAGAIFASKQENENAKTLYLKACDLNHHESCVNLGEIYENEGNCNKASEIYKDTFENKKFKPAQAKFEALVGNEKCMSDEIKRQKEEAQKEIDAKIKALKPLEALEDKACEPGDGRKYYLQGINYENNQTVSEAVMLKVFQKSCDCGEAKSCDEVANIYMKNYNNLSSKDRETALNATKRACDGNIVTGCQKQIVATERSMGIFDIKDRQEKERKIDELKEKIIVLTANHEKLCKAGSGLENALNCHWLADFYLSTDRDHEVAEAARLYDRACGLDINGSCYMVGKIYLDGHNSRTNPDDTINVDFGKARSFYRKACDADVKIACKNLGALYTLSEFEKDCDANSSDACLQAGKMHARGNESERYFQYIAPNLAKAQEFYKKACELNNYEACNIWGMNAAEIEYKKESYKYDEAKNALFKACDNGVQKACANLEKWVELRDLENSCEKNNVEDCLKLANLYWNGYGRNSYMTRIKPDNRKATKTYKKACELENTSACYYAGNIYYKGDVARQDYDIAMEFYKKACDGEFALACRSLGAMYYDGVGVEKNMAKAAEYYGEGCDLGDNSERYNSCEMYKKAKNAK